MVKLNYDATSRTLVMGKVGGWFELPAEMRERRQWAVSTLTVGADGKPDKSPRRSDGAAMDWRNPLEWLTFEQAVSAGFPAIGFILSPVDPFTIIDLDVKDDTPQEHLDRYGQIMAAFASYTELSQSGKGLHIVLHGRIGGGLRRDGVEVYDQDRYMICTGDYLEGRSQIVSAPDLLARMVAEMGGVRSTAELPPSEPETALDDELLERMANARNGARFKQLFYGPVDMGSENDAALFSLLGFYTKNHDQILRLFARSCLYRPRGEADGKKGHTATTYHEKYLVDTLARSLQARSRWDEERAADIEHGRELAKGLAQAATCSAPLVEAPPLEMPPGLVGEIAEYIYHSAPRPLKEVAIAGALAMMAGICGRQFNVSSGAGLNLYIILLAESGMGKEGAKNGVDRLFAAVRKEAPGLGVFLGPRVVSGPAFEKAVVEHNPCFISFVGEIGVRLQSMLSARGGDPLLKAAWLGLYTAAVRGGRHQGAFHSKKEDRTENVEFPCVSLFGESTPSEYYKAISGANFDDGFVPRFLTLSNRETQIRALNPARGLPPSTGLVERLAGLGQHCVDLQVRDQYVEVRFGEGITAEKIDAYYMAKASNLSPGPLRVSWTRAPMLMFKVAALLAVGVNHNNPTITQDCMDWAARLVEGSISEVGRREEAGDLGSADTRKLPKLERAIKDYFQLPDAKKSSTYRVPDALLKTSFIPYTFLRRRLKMNAEYADDPRGMVPAIKQTLQDAVDMGMLARVTPEQALTETGGKYRSQGADLYCLGPAWSND